MSEEGDMDMIWKSATAANKHDIDDQVKWSEPTEKERELKLVRISVWERLELNWHAKVELDHQESNFTVQLQIDGEFAPSFRWKQQ